MVIIENAEARLYTNTCWSVNYKWFRIGNAKIGILSQM